MIRLSEWQNDQLLKCKEILRARARVRAIYLSSLFEILLFVFVFKQNCLCPDCEHFCVPLFFFKWIAALSSHLHNIDMRTSVQFNVFLVDGIVYLWAYIFVNDTAICAHPRPQHTHRYSLVTKKLKRLGLRSSNAIHHKNNRRSSNCYVFFLFFFKLN